MSVAMLEDKIAPDMHIVIDVADNKVVFREPANAEEEQPFFEMEV